MTSHAPVSCYTRVHCGRTNGGKRRIVTDIVSQKTRSRMMAGITGRNTKPELTLRKALHGRGVRYRLHARDVHGQPDLVLPKYRAVIFVHGCFWHRHSGCRYATTPATRTGFWMKKFAANVQRDANVKEMLASTGWRVAIVWECALRKSSSLPPTIEAVIYWLNSDDAFLELGEVGTTSDSKFD